jgi:2-hydroxy-3-keto-5-methylthiopentenyl-1-phosphate phosphatase
VRGNRDRSSSLRTEAARARWSLVLDWDGTVTERDTLGLLIEEFGDVALWKRTGAARGSGFSNNDGIALGFAAVRVPLAEALAWLLPRVRVRRGFHELVARHRPLIVSSGFRELIARVLAAEGLEPGRDLDLLANSVEPRADGWRVSFRDTRVCGTCREPCKRASLPDGTVVFVGDGYSDRCAALAASRVFATGALTAFLRERGVPHERFDDFHDVLAALPAREEPLERARP